MQSTSEWVETLGTGSRIHWTVGIPDSKGEQIVRSADTPVQYIVFSDYGRVNRRLSTEERTAGSSYWLGRYDHLRTTLSFSPTKANPQKTIVEWQKAVAAHAESPDGPSSPRSPRTLAALTEVWTCHERIAWTGDDDTYFF
jgi:hypothetical protein